MITTLTDKEFAFFQRFIFDAAGISLSPAKKALVCGRLSKRLQHRRLGTFQEYVDLLASGMDRAEVQTAIDLLTTNETYFFREPKHFDWLREEAKLARNERRDFRVWSAACSSGEEPYSIAMVLADVLDPRPWTLIGSDLSTRVLERARAGHYPTSRAQNVSPDYLRRFCLKGTGNQEGSLLVDRPLRTRVDFRQVNLNERLPQIGPFDIIFLRNVMIYFNAQTKRDVVARVTSLLRPGGLFLIGHSESLADMKLPLRQIAPAVYRKPEQGGE
jgi:chemotaxis protein methyltransferase CheR